MIEAVLRDKLYWASIAAAFLFCVSYVLLLDKSFDVSWLINQPEKLLLLVFIYPLLEEATFRGFLQSYLLRNEKFRLGWKGVSTANFITSIVFSFVHIMYHSIGWSLAVFVPSVLFGYFREKYGSIKPSIALHSSFNLIFYLIVGL